MHVGQGGADLVDRYPVARNGAVQREQQAFTQIGQLQQSQEAAVT
jgi:expansin (peptidoglycan-binding protein)